jgi:glycosyltransferase involved in cell wall biosynthesis
MRRYASLGAEACSTEVSVVNTADEPKVSVVIPVRDGAETIGEQLGALAAQECDAAWELVVADNGSTDETAAIARSFARQLPSLRVVSEDHAAGINVARNAGVRAARGPLIVICDADDVVQPGWLAAHVAGLERFDVTGGPLDQRALNPPQVAAFNERKQDGCPVTGRFLPYATGCNLGFRREVWDAIGGFDDTWVRGATEIEFCWRAQLAGFSLGWLPDAMVAYRQQPNLWSEVRRRFRAARANPRLYASFRDYGMPPTRLAPAMRGWAWLIYRAPWAAVSRQWRLKWLQVLAWRAGLVAGSIRYRVRYV